MVVRVFSSRSAVGWWLKEWRFATLINQSCPNVLMHAYIGIPTPKNVMGDHVLICGEIEVVSNRPSFSLVSNLQD
jgi:hypothetical protein